MSRNSFPRPIRGMRRRERANGFTIQQHESGRHQACPAAPHIGRFSCETRHGFTSAAATDREGVNVHVDTILDVMVLGTC
jgi:hypothetical protein